MRIEDIFENLTDSLKEYANIKAVSIKLSLVEKLSLLARDILSTLIILFLTTVAIIFAFLAAMIFVARYIGFVYGSLLICAILASIAVVIYLLKERIFTNIFVAVFSRLLFEKDTNDEKE